MKIGKGFLGVLLCRLLRCRVRTVCRPWSLVVFVLFVVFRAGMAQAQPFVYVANQGSNNISAYRADAESGGLSLIGTFPVGVQPRGIGVDPSGQFLFVANQGSGDVSAFRIVPTTGALTSIPGSPFPAGPAPNGVRVEPSGRFLYVTNCFSSNCYEASSGNIAGYSINGDTGVLTTIEGSPFSAGAGPAELAVDASGQFAYAANRGSDNVSAYTIGAVTGVLRQVNGSPFSAGRSPFGVTTHPTAPLVYVTNVRSNDIWVYAIETSGALTPIGGSPFLGGSTPVILAFDPSAQFAYVANCGDEACTAAGSVSGYTVDGEGVPRDVPGSPFGAGTGSWGVVVDPSGRFAYLTNRGSDNGTAYTIDRITGGLAPIGNFTTGNFPVAIAITAGPTAPQM